VLSPAATILINAVEARAKILELVSALNGSGFKDLT
jgi:hypothetical protein